MEKEVLLWKSVPPVTFLASALRGSSVTITRGVAHGLRSPVRTSAGDWIWTVSELAICPQAPPENLFNLERQSHRAKTIG